MLTKYLVLLLSCAGVLCGQSVVSGQTVSNGELVIPYASTLTLSPSYAAESVTLSGNVTAIGMPTGQFGGETLHLTICQGTGGPYTIPASWTGTVGVTTIAATGCTRFHLVWDDPSGIWVSTTDGLGSSGPQGPAGPAGATGAAGPAGATGPGGATGPAGSAGSTGAAGPAGAAGATGPAGTAATPNTASAPLTIAGNNIAISLTPLLLVQDLYPAVAGASMELPLTEGTGTTAYDISGNGNNGTFATGTSAPTWYTYGVSFLDTGTAASPGQYINTPLTTFGTAYFAHCTPTMVQTTGTATGSIPAAEYPTFWGANTGTTSGLLLLGTTVATTTFNSPQPTIFNGSSGTSKTIAGDSFGGCHIYGFSAGSSTDHITVDGVETNYSAQGASGSGTTLTAGQYSIGNSTPSGVLNVLRGTMQYVVVFPTAHTVAQMQQETLYIKQRLATRPTMPHYPILSTVRTAMAIFPGDSLTAGYEGTSQWTAALTLSNSYTVVNWGIGGMLARDVCKMSDQRWVSSIVPGQSIVHLWAGTNDNYGVIPPADAWASLVSCVVKAHTYGARIVVATMLSRTNSSGAYQAYDTYKDNLNALIRANWRQAGFDGLNDLAEVAAIGADGANTTTACFNADHIHLTGPGTGTCATIGSTALSGYGIVAALASNAINSLDGSSAANPTVTASTAFAAVAANNYVVDTPTAAATFSLQDCQGRTTPTTVVNGSGTYSITVNTLNSQALTGSATVSPNAIATFISLLTGSTTGGCSWVRTQ